MPYFYCISNKRAWLEFKCLHMYHKCFWLCLHCCVLLLEVDQDYHCCTSTVLACRSLKPALVQYFGRREHKWRFIVSYITGPPHPSECPYLNSDWFPIFSSYICPWEGVVEKITQVDLLARVSKFFCMFLKGVQLILQHHPDPIVPTLLPVW